MGSMRRRGFTRALLAGLALALITSPSPATVPTDASPATVTHVSDGDTAYLRPLLYGTRAASWPGRKARFIGVDTPEVYTSPPDCYGEAASRFTRNKLEGERVKVTYGEDTLDQYGRALIYIWRNGRLFNATLVRKGFAKVEIYSPNDRYASWLYRLQNEAKAASRGLWGAC
jgi:micrococcal nuclease